MSKAGSTCKTLLSFEHPATGKWMSFDSELPGDLGKLLTRWQAYAQTLFFLMNTRIIAIVAGGYSGELEVSLRSAPISEEMDRQEALFPLPCAFGSPKPGLLLRIRVAEKWRSHWIEISLDLRMISAVPFALNML